MPEELVTNVELKLLATRFVVELPVIIIAAIGLWFAWSRRSIHARVSAWACGGFGLLIAHSLIQLLLVLLMETARDLPPSEISGSITQVGLWSFGTYPLFILGIALLARAVFVDRAVRPIGE